ncbi:MAG: DNA integrity scanning diadenylate cyclase DisA [Clostridia bacterium]|nr:DNA integrity scanning diadenylate cyclase DisA [Clostridia bacterium]
MREVWGRNEELLQILKTVAPGTDLREGLENILKARTGALIVISDSEEAMSLADGGFKINEDYSPARLYELAKMDGAIVLSKDAKKILLANTQLIPDPSIPTVETGTRHRSGERLAKQTGELVVSISQRRNLITVFKGNIRYVIKDSSQVLARANQALQTVEKYKSSFDEVMLTLNEFEFEDIVTMENVVKALQRAELMMRVVAEVQGYIIELGDEGRLIDMQLKELAENVELEEMLIIKDYAISNEKEDTLLTKISELSHSELMDSSIIAKLLGYSIETTLENIESTTRGYRLLSRIPKLPMNIIDNMVKALGNFQDIIRASTEELDDVEGIGEVRAKNIKQGIKRMQEQALYDSRYYR